MEMKSLATIVASFADLDKADPVLMSITRELIMKQSDIHTLAAAGEKVQDLRPTDCTQLMRAFC